VVATAVALVGVLLGAAWLLRGSPSRIEDTLPFASRSSTTSVATAVVTTATTGAPAAIVVYVAGDVVAPGVYTLGPGSRVNDAVAAAGGAAADADLGVVNLAAVLNDGQRVFVPAVGQAVPPEVPTAPISSSTSTPGPVNINTAGPDDLDVLPGVGPATAAAIIAHRQQYGPFQTVDQLAEVRGIGPAKLDALRGLVTV
jgi:competence protein ComEA